MLLLFLIGFSGYAQEISSVKLNDFYSGNLDEVLDEIGEEKGLVFEFDRDRLKKAHVADRFFNKPLSDFLTAKCRKLKLKWYVGANGIIYLIDRNARPTEEVSAVQPGRTTEMEPTAFDFTLSGTLLDVQTGETLPFANIMLSDGTNGTLTNQDGLFVLNGVPTDTNTLFISCIGYESLTFALAPDMAKDHLEIEVRPRDLELEAVTITAEREDLLRSNEELGVITLSPRQLSRLPNIGEKDIMRSFQLMPGISASNESSAGLYVRGGTPDQNLVLFDGFTVYHVDHLYGFFSAFNSNTLKDVKLYKGGFESRYGGRLSSVLDITGKDGNAKEFNVGGEISLLSVNGFVEVPIGDKITTLVAARRSFQGPIYNKIFEQFNGEAEEQTAAPGGRGGRGGQQASTTVASFFYDLNAKVTYRPTEDDVISASFFNGTDKLDNGFSRETPEFLAAQGIDLSLSVSDLTRYGNVGSSLKWSRKWNPKFYGNTVLSFSNYYSTRDRSREGSVTNATGEANTFSNGTFENNDLIDYSLHSDYTLALGKHNQLAFGGFGTWYDIAYSYAQNDTSTILDRDDQAGLAGGYVQDRISLFNDRLKVTPGIRGTGFGMTNKLYWEPRASASLNLTDRIKVAGSWGHYYQFANRVLREDLLNGSRDFWILSDGESVPVSFAEHYIAGVSYENKDLLMSVEGWYKNLDGISEYSLRFTGGRGEINYQENFFSGVGYSKGLEFLLRKKTGAWTGWASYTLAETRNQIDVYGEDYFAAAQDVTHEFKLVNLYRLNRFNFAATWVFATGRPYTAPEGGYSLTLLDGTSSDFITAGAKNSYRLPNYHRLDVSATYDLRNKDGNNIGNIGFSIFNLYNRKNTWYKEYEIVEGQVLETDQQFLGFTPNLSLSLKLR